MSEQNENESPKDGEKKEDKKVEKKATTAKKETASEKEATTEKLSAQKTKSKIETPAAKKKNIFQKQPLVFILLGALLISVVWGNYRANKIERELTLEHKRVLQAERELLGTTLVNTMALTLRSELTRNNNEQAEQYMVEFLRSDLNILRVSFMDQSTREIAFSTDKSYESRGIEDEFILNTKEAGFRQSENGLLLTAPVKGLSRQLGVLIINWEFESND
jgi:hypothetical protein